MKSLSATVLAKQKAWGINGCWKAVFTSGATTYGYESPQIAFAKEIEATSSQIAQLTVINRDNDFTALALQGYKCVLSWGIRTGVARAAWQAGHAYSLNDVVIPTTANKYQYKCTTAGTSHATTEPTWTTAIGTTISDNTVTWTVDGEQKREYSECAPMWVEAQQLDSIRGQRTAHLSLAGMFNLMAKDEASADYILLSTDTQTVKTLLTAVANATVVCYSGCTSWDVQYDTGWDDGLINAVIPADSFKINERETRFSVLERLLGNYTKDVMRPGNDGKLHILNPVVSGTTYDAEYALTVDAHKFLGQTYRRRLVIPSKIVVNTRVGDTPAYTGSATDASYDANEPAKNKIAYYRFKVASDAQCASIAAAILQKAQQDAEKGVAIIPPDIGSELWDYDNVLDKDMSDINRTGNIQYIERTGDTGELIGHKPDFRMNFTFGKPGQTALGTTTPSLGYSADGSNLDNRLSQAEMAINGLSQADLKYTVLISDIYSRLPQDKQAVIAFIIDGGGAAITTGQKGHLEIPFACTINRATVLADQSGSIVVDIWKDTYANFPPADADSITASAPPTLSTAQKSQDATLTGWTRSISAGDVLAYNCDSAATVQRVLIALRVTRT